MCAGYGEHLKLERGCSVAQHFRISFSIEEVFRCFIKAENLYSQSYEAARLPGARLY